MVCYCHAEALGIKFIDIAYTRTYALDANCKQLL